jgi:hypothetical protein
MGCRCAFRACHRNGRASVGVRACASLSGITSRTRQTHRTPGPWGCGRLASNRCPPGWVERSLQQRHSPRSAGTCLLSQPLNSNRSPVDPGLSGSTPPSVESGLAVLRSGEFATCRGATPAEAVVGEVPEAMPDTLSLRFNPGGGVCPVQVACRRRVGQAARPCRCHLPPWAARRVPERAAWLVYPPRRCAVRAGRRRALQPDAVPVAAAPEPGATGAAGSAPTPP